RLHTIELSERGGVIVNCRRIIGLRRKGIPLAGCHDALRLKAEGLRPDHGRDKKKCAPDYEGSCNVASIPHHLNDLPCRPESPNSEAQPEGIHHINRKMARSI